MEKTIDIKTRFLVTKETKKTTIFIITNVFTSNSLFNIVNIATIVASNLLYVKKNGRDQKKYLIKFLNQLPTHG